jgi:7,8-dihydro-6-hydroxymethylpterin dimethyltransferase
LNLSPCNTCKDLSPATTEERDGKVFLVKDCPRCGHTETLISSDARRYWGKHELDAGFDHQACDFQCQTCHHRQALTLMFIDITNRCNMNCPICINNTPSMGFLFEPPLEYFEKIFKHCASLDPKPAVQLFGGEPTMRKDLIDIVKSAQKHGLRVRIVTNGLKLANEEYARELLKYKPTILIAYDGANPKLYEELRGSTKVLDIKLKAIETLRRIGKAKVTLMTLVAKDYNAEEIRELIDYCHERRGMIRAIYLMPLAHTWDSSKWDYDPERITTEDLEHVVQKAFPDEPIDFLPAGFLGNLPTLLRCFRTKPLPFLGAHPNCESLYMLFSDGEKYVPFAHLFKGSLFDAAKAAQKAEERLARQVQSFESGVFGRLLGRLGLKEAALTLMGVWAVGSVARRHLRIMDNMKGKGLGKLYHAGMALIELLLGGRTKRIQQSHMRIEDFLQIIILPFEDQFNRETDRLERCPAAFAYVDPEDDRVKSTPVCVWGIHKTEIMRAIAAQGDGKQAEASSN